MSIENILARLSKSKFRNSFQLNERDHKYLLKIGFETSKQHAVDFIQTRLSVPKPGQDGHQTPTKGHPVFVAQHASATCCRFCLHKWHKIAPERPLSESQIEYIANVILAWLRLQVPRQEKPKVRATKKVGLPLMDFLEQNDSDEIT